MKIIKENPYRTVGLLVGATAREQERQVKRLKQFIEAEQEPQDDFSFPVLGKLHRTIDSVTNAAAKLNLDSDKMNAALFWFWNGNPITDEAAFDALKENDIDTAYQIWDKLITETKEDGQRFWKPVTERNYSAFHNCFVINLLKANGNLHNAIVANLYFIESDLLPKFISSVADETFKTSKKEIQLLFLNQLFQEANEKISQSRLIEIINKQEFIAKEDFLKGFSQQLVEPIEQKIEIAKNKRKASKSNAVITGQELLDTTKNHLSQLKATLGASSSRYAGIADKVANEILQCSIDYFNECQEKESSSNYFEPAMKLARSALTIAIGKLTKDRIDDSINTLEEMKDREISQAVQLLQSIKEAYEENEREIQQEIKRLEATDIDILLGRKTINRSAVENNIKNSINWQKVNDLLNELLRSNILKKFKASDNVKLKAQFLELANWLKEHSLKKSTIESIIDNYKKIRPELPFRILSSVVTNTDNKPLYTKYIRYIGLNLNVDAAEEKTVAFYIKYVKPNGSINRNSKTSPNGYTHLVTQKINLHTNSINLSGWGNSDKCTFDIGEHSIEVYVDEYMIHSKKFIVDLSPSEKLEIELKKEEDKLNEIRKTQYFKSELATAQDEMNKIKEWHFLRSQSDRESQINEQQSKIDSITKKSQQEKEKYISQQQIVIAEIKSKIQKAEY